MEKSGFKSSEFWLHVLFAAVGGAWNVASKSSDPVVVVGLQVAAAIYTAARTYLKSLGSVALPDPK